MTKIDYTKYRLHSKPNSRPIVICPKCQRKGELHKFKDGRTHIIHTSHIVMGMFNNIDESCLFMPGEYNAK